MNDDTRAVRDGSGTAVRRRLSAAMEWLSPALCLVLGCGLGIHALVQVWGYGFSELYSDQFGQYRRMIEGGMPEALFRPDNGHRQVFSNVVRWLDIAYGWGDQRGQIVSALAAMFAAWGVAGLLAWRAAAPDRLAAACSWLLLSIALFWFGSARMQFHGNEALQVYLVIICALLAHAALLARGRPAWLRIAVALLCALAGMLSFATGVAIFGSLVALCIVLRRPAGETVLLVGASIACLAGYLFLLPGGDGVRHTLSLDPLGALRIMLTWLGSAPVTGWLALGVEGLFGATPERIAAAGLLSAAMVDSSALLRSLLGLSQANDAALLAGSAGCLLLLALLVRAWRLPYQVNGSERLGLGLSLFAAAVAGVVAIGRQQYFVEHPVQLLADRYVLWTALFWAGLLIAVLARWQSTRSGRLAAIGTVVLVAVLMLPSHRTGAGWARASERAIEARAAQAQSNVLLPGWSGFANLASLEEVQESLRFYREQSLAIFRSPRSRSLGQTLPAARLAESGDAAPMDWWIHACRPVDAAADRLPQAWHVAGVVARRYARDEGLVALDAAGRVIGLGEFGFSEQPIGLRHVAGSGRGFDLYLRFPSPPRDPEVRLFVADPAMRELRPLRPLACAAP